MHKRLIKKNQLAFVFALVHFIFYNRVLLIKCVWLPELQRVFKETKFIILNQAFETLPMFGLFQPLFRFQTMFGLRLIVALWIGARDFAI